jgi:hypothetical protein
MSQTCPKHVPNAYFSVCKCYGEKHSCPKHVPNSPKHIPNILKTGLAVINTTPAMSSTIRTRKWREKQVDLIGEKKLKQIEALRRRINRKQKKIKPEVSHHGDIKFISRKARVSTAKDKSYPTKKKVNKLQKPSPKEKTDAQSCDTKTDTSPPITLDDDIYSSNKDIEYKESDITTSHMVFKHPATILVAGPTFSGKSFFTMKLLENRDEMIQPNISEIIWCYGIESPQLKVLKQKFPDILKLHKGLPDIDKLAKTPEGFNRVLIIDDLMGESKGSTLSNLFTKGSHHLGLSIVYIVQNVFHQSKEMRNIFLNSMYKILFYNPGDVTQLSILNNRMYPGHPGFIPGIMKHLAKHPHAYLAFDQHPRTPEELRVRSHIFPGEENTVYLPS